MGKQVTIRDVARHAGVSVATASRALNDPDYPVNAVLRMKVKEAAAQLEYVPNVLARSLRREVCRDIALVIPNISNPFYLQAMLGINDVLMKNSYSLILCNTMWDVEKERQYLRQLYERQTRGVILSSVDDKADCIKEYAGKGMHFVLLDQMLSGVEFPGINFDSRSGARMAVEHLISKGHRRIAFGTMPLNRWTRIEMHKGYRDALVRQGIDYQPSLVYECSVNGTDLDSDLELRVGHRITEAFLRDGCPATAILCVNDMVAIGVIQALMKNGKRVPQDVSVIGFDDIPFASAVLPALTTIHCPVLETGRLATLMLMDILSGSGELTLSMNLSPQLMERDTVAPPKNP